MQTVIITAERVTRTSLSAVIPNEGVASVRVTRGLSVGRDATARKGYRSYRNPARFTPAVRIALVVDDDTVSTVFDALSTAHFSGFFSDAEIWIEPPTLALSA